MSKILTFKSNLNDSVHEINFFNDLTDQINLSLDEEIVCEINQFIIKIKLIEHKFNDFHISNLKQYIFNIDFNNKNIIDKIYFSKNDMINDLIKEDIIKIISFMKVSNII